LSARLVTVGRAIRTRQSGVFRSGTRNLSSLNSLLMVKPFSFDLEVCFESE
jgi:hypothetical protein